MPACVIVTCIDITVQGTLIACIRKYGVFNSDTLSLRNLADCKPLTRGLSQRRLCLQSKSGYSRVRSANGGMHPSHPSCAVCILSTADSALYHRDRYHRWKLRCPI